MTGTRRSISPGLALAGIVGWSAIAWAATVHDVHQYGRAFLVAKLDIARGDVLRFINDDPFLHQMYVSSDAFSFDSNEQAPGTTIDVTFPAAGTFIVQCHIHPKMRLVVNVK